MQPWIRSIQRDLPIRDARSGKCRAAALTGDGSDPGQPNCIPHVSTLEAGAERDSVQVSVGRRMPQRSKTLDPSKSGEIDMLSEKTKISKSVQAIAAVGLLSAAATASASCRTAAVNCAADYSGMLLACAAATEALGTVPVFDYGCYAAAAATVGGCNEMAESCGQDTTSNNAPVSSGGVQGNDDRNLKQQRITCGNLNPESQYINRVRALHFKLDTIGTAGPYISAIRMTCTSGDRGYFVDNSGTSGSTWSGTKCPEGRLVQGIWVRSLTKINAMAITCDAVGYSAGDSDNVRSFWYGGGSGTEYKMICPEGKYVYGLNVWYDDAIPLDKRVVEGIEPLCRGYS
jgi:hypothetical protein